MLFEYIIFFNFYFFEGQYKSENTTPKRNSRKVLLSNHIIIEYLVERGPQDSFAVALPRQCSPHLCHSSILVIQPKDSKEKM